MNIGTASVGSRKVTPDQNAVMTARAVGEAPALWADPDNWVGGSPASGQDATATFTGSGTKDDVVWVKLPDDEYVDLCHIAHGGSNTSAKFRFIGGKGFRLFRYDGSGTNGRALIEATGDANGCIDTYFPR